MTEHLIEKKLNSYDNFRHQWHPLLLQQPSHLLLSYRSLADLVSQGGEESWLNNSIAHKGIEVENKL